MSGIRYSGFNARKAFTLVEVLVVITVIAILLGVSIFVSTKYQQTARDSEREAKATVLTTALEKYYESNNEYPNCTELTATPASVKSSTLTNIADVSVFEAPGVASGVNSIQCTTDVNAVTKDKFTYTCTNTTTPCDGWELKYRKESDGNVVSIASASGSGATSNEGAPAVTVSATLSGSNVVATASATCSSGEPEYQIRYYKNSGSFPGTWTNGASASVPVNEGEGATFQAQARCLQFGFAATPYNVSSSDTANRAVTAPTGLATSLAISGANGTGTVTGGSCATGTTLQRQIRNLTNYFAYGGAWSSYADIAVSTQTLPVNEGWAIAFHQQARCVNSTTSVASAWTNGPSASGVRPINTLGAPSVSAVGSTTKITYNWSGSACPTQTTKEYQYQMVGSWGYTSGWYGPTSDTSFEWLDSAQGYTFTLQVQQRCTNSYATSTWSALGQASYSRPAPPAAPTGLLTSVSISGANAVGSVTGGTCAPGTTLRRQIQHLDNYYLYGGAWSGLLDISGTTQTLPIEQGWQMNFHQQARCEDPNTGLVSAWTWGPVGNAVRPISEIGAPSLSFTDYPAKVVFNWASGGNACPAQTTREYRYQIGASTDWWGPTTGTSFEWLDGSQGYDYTLKVQQRCTSGYVSSPWSVSNTKTFSRNVEAPGQATGFTKDTPYGRVGIAFNWNAPTCGTGAYPQYRMDWANGGGTGILWMGRRTDGWWFGGTGTGIPASNPSTAWTDSWPTAGFGYMADKGNAYAPNPPNMDLDAGDDDLFDKDNQIGISVEYRCRNGVTGAFSGPGPKNGMIYTWP